jgi:hypothetical protein
MLEPRNSQDGADRPSLGRDADRSTNDAPLADREVPLPGAELGATPMAVQAWLDGEASEADARLADAKQVALWNRIADETSARRRVATPAHVHANIMNALPAATPSLATSVAKAAAPVAAASGMIALSPVTAILAAAGLIAAGFLLARLVG